MDNRIIDILTKFAKDFNKELSDYIKRYRTSPLYNNEMSAVFDAFDYSLLAGGKRLRAFLVFTFNRLCGGNPHNALPLAIALEMIHTYSLIHDDLPCMDNDDLRRGKPTNHKVFGEATALLAGDALLTEAFSVISNADISDKVKIESIRILSQNAGILGMIAGQEIDLKSENAKISIETLLLLHSRKTGKLFEAACLLGCISSDNSSEEITSAALSFANSFGLAFQITDDILDVTGETEALGKNVGSDDKTHKSTFVSLLGIEGAKDVAQKQILLAKQTLMHAFNEIDIKDLCDLCDYILTRRS